VSSSSKHSDYIIHYIASFSEDLVSIYRLFLPSWCTQELTPWLTTSKSFPVIQLLHTITCTLHGYIVEPTPRGEGGKPTSMQACSTQQTTFFCPTNFLVQAMILTSITTAKNHFQCRKTCCNINGTA